MSRGEHDESPVELRFIDLFLMIIAALVFVTVAILLRGLGSDDRPHIVTRAFPAAIVGEPYEVPLAASGGAAPLRWRIDGSLPDGFAFVDGVIRGTPTTAGSRMFLATVTDQEGATETRRLTLAVRVAEPFDPRRRKWIRIVSPAIALNDGRSGTRYAARFRGGSAEGVQRWMLVEGSLPRGLSFSESGVLSGVPQVEAIDPWIAPFSAHNRRLAKRRAGTFRFTIAATSGGKVEQRGVLLYIEPSPPGFWARLLTGDLAPDDSGWMRVAWLLLWLFVPLTLLVLLFFAALPLLLLNFGFPRLIIDGWRGVFVRPHWDPDRAPLPPSRAAFTIAAARFMAFLLALMRLLLAIAIAVGRAFRGAARLIGEALRGVGRALFGDADPDGDRAAWFGWKGSGGRGGHSNDDREEGGGQPAGGEEGEGGDDKGLWDHVHDWMYAGKVGEEEESWLLEPKEVNGPGSGTHRELEDALLALDEWERGGTSGGDGGGRGGGRGARGGGGRGGGGGEGPKTNIPPALLRRLRRLGQRARHGSRRRVSFEIVPRPERTPDKVYLDSLRRGGSVRHGGAFLALPFADRIGLADSAMAVHREPYRGLGLVHFTLDEFLRRAGGITGRPRKSFDRRFDVVLSRSGPAPPPPPEAGQKPPLPPTAGVQGGAAVPAIPPDHPLLATIASSANQAQDWLAGLLPDTLPRSRRVTIARSLLRKRAHIRLEDDVVHVRFARPFREADAAAVQSAFDQLNRQPARTIGWMSFPIRFELRA